LIKEFKCQTKNSNIYTNIYTNIYIHQYIHQYIYIYIYICLYRHLNNLFLTGSHREWLFVLNRSWYRYCIMILFCILILTLLRRRSRCLLYRIFFLLTGFFLGTSTSSSSGVTFFLVRDFFLGASSSSVETFFLVSFFLGASSSLPSSSSGDFLSGDLVQDSRSLRTRMPFHPHPTHSTYLQ